MHQMQKKNIPNKLVQLIAGREDFRLTPSRYFTAQGQSLLAEEDAECLRSHFFANHPPRQPAISDGGRCRMKV